MSRRERDHDVIVIGAGHAGCEAALATARMGFYTLVITMNIDTIGQMSCNPAIGGVAKGHLVKEIDALGGEMAKAIDDTAIQFRTLNASKGPAVRATRAQADRNLYRLRMRRALESTGGLRIRQATVERLIVEEGKEGLCVKGVLLDTGERLSARTVIVTAGTFLQGLIHIGLVTYPGGRAGDMPSTGLSKSLRELGFRLRRFKTGTCPRLDARTIDYSKLEVQELQKDVSPFSYSTNSIDRPQVPCHITYTNEKTHRVIRENLDRSPLFSGIIEGTGPRYCPSIEDKVVRFAHRKRHQVFLEPEGYNTKEVYPNGLSTSLPVDVQIRFLRTIPGLEDVEILRPGYAVEYDVIDPTQLGLNLESRNIKNLFFAGQINGTSGYEEAASQGIIAGINAALRLRNKAPFILRRHEAYTGVLIDDLVTKGTSEPYRLFTSRAEYRLLLREDNAELRLREKGFRLGLVDSSTYKRFEEKRNLMESLKNWLHTARLNPSKEVNEALRGLGLEEIRRSVTLCELLRRPDVTLNDIFGLVKSGKDLSLPFEVARAIEVETKYEGYIKRQIEEAERFRKVESVKIPEDISYDDVQGLSAEIREKLKHQKPLSIGQAGRISGVTPAAVSMLMIHLKKMGAC